MKLKTKKVTVKIRRNKYVDQRYRPGLWLVLIDFILSSLVVRSDLFQWHIAIFQDHAFPIQYSGAHAFDRA